MRVPRNALLALILTGFASLLAPVRAQAAILGIIQEGNSILINGLTLTNRNNFAVTLNDFGLAVINEFGDPSDVVWSFQFAGGTCSPLLGAPKGFLANAACTVNLGFSALDFSTPPADFGEPLDFGVEQFQLSGNTTPGGNSYELPFEIRVNDVTTPTPEPGSLTLITLGLPGMIALIRRSRQRAATNTTH